VYHIPGWNSKKHPFLKEFLKEKLAFEKIFGKIVDGGKKNLPIFLTCM
jgi:hypothetical protein